MNKPLRVGSICSGIEAASMAWKPLGMEFVFYSEIEPFPCALLKERHPETPNLGDMTKFKKWPKYEKTKDGSGGIDIIIGGTPCQSFSVAGLRKGLADPRGNLALTFLAIVERHQPTWVVWENVPGVHSSWSDVQADAASEEFRHALEEARRACFNAGLDAGPEFDAGEFEEVDQSNDFDCFLAALGQLGYGTATRILDAQYFGLAQRRERVFVVGHIGGQWQRAAAVLFERESLRGDPPPGRETGKGVAPGVTGGPPFSRTGNERIETEALVETAGTLSARTKGGGGLGTDFDCSSAIPVTCGTITKNYATHHGRTAGANGGVVPGQVIPINMQAAAKNGKKSPNMLGIGDPGDPANTVNASDQHAVAISFAQNTRDEVREIGGGIAGALSAEPGTKQQTYVAIPIQEVSKRTGKSTDDPRAGIGIGKDGDPSYTIQAGAQHGVAIPIGIEGGETGFALRANPSHSGDKGDGGVNTTLVAEIAATLRSCSSPEAGHSARAGDKDENLVIESAEVSPTLRSNPRNNSNPSTNADMLVTHALKAEGFDASEDGTGRGTPLVPEISHTLTNRDYKGATPESAKGGHLIPEVTGALSDGAHNGAGLNGQDAYTGRIFPAKDQVQKMAVRRLTPLECERLQGFPDDYTLITWRGKPACDGPRYKAIGNSMAVPVIKWIGEQILKIHSIQ